MAVPSPYAGATINSSNITSFPTYTLPGYGGQVKVTWTATPSQLYFNRVKMPAVDPPIPSVLGYTWGAGTTAINMYNSQLGVGPVSYTVTFSFLSGLPVLSKLVLVVAGLADTTTTAVVSPTVSLLCDYQYGNFSPTSFIAPNVIKSGWASGDTTDQYNTGWALFSVAALTSVSPPSLSVRFSHGSGDGIGVTLGYTVDRGLLKICKVAGPGVAVGTSFSFTASGSNSFTVPAGPTPGGTCVVGPSFPVGSTVTVTETIPPGDTVSSITVAPPSQLVSGTLNLAAGSVSVTMGSGVTEVTFTDENRTGFLEICKQGKVTGSFSFMVSPGGLGPFVVPAGACSPAIAVVAGPVVITEQPTAGTAMTAGCSTIPPGQQGPCNPGAHTSTVTIVPGDVSTMTIAFVTNKLLPPTTAFGTNK
jgi:hypothetical protein